MTEKVTVLEPPKGWRLLDLKELVEYRDLFRFLVWRDIKVLYAQTILGFAWAILNPAIQIVVFSLIFGKVARLPTDGIPYVLFSTVAVVPWTYMSNALTSSSQSLVSGQNRLGTMYFPRFICPATSVLAKMVDFAISLLLVFAVMAWYRVAPTWNLLFLPVFVLMMMAVPLAAGLWLSAMAIRFRDVKFASQFVIRMLVYSAPILYTASRIPEEWRMVYSINPIVGVIEGFRATLLGFPIPWQFVFPGMITLAVMLLGGILYFRRMERTFVDVI